jgi:hypothetical protein
MGVLACVVAVLSGCVSAPRAGGADQPGGALVVRCEQDGIHVDAPDVHATEAGVPLLVSSSAPEGTYVNLAWRGGGQGDPAPTAPTTWNVSAPPGELEIGCSNPGVPEADWPRTSVTVHDDGHWSGRTLADYGCSGTSAASWVDIPRASQGARSADAALDGVLPLFRLRGDVGIEPVEVGYSGADHQTWIVSQDGTPYVAVEVIRSGDRYSASPGSFCD